MYKIVVLISGNGSNLQAIIDACESKQLHAIISAVFSNKQDAYGLKRAQKAGIQTHVVEKATIQSRQQYDALLAKQVQHYAPDVIVLAGFMRVLSDAFLSQFPKRVINLHPALPAAFTGLHAIERALQAYKRGEIAHTGVMVHYVPDESVDAGPVIAQENVAIYEDDDLMTLSERIHQTERRVLLSVLQEKVHAMCSAVRA